MSRRRSQLPSRLHQRLWWKLAQILESEHYCKRPFGGPKEVLRYLARYTHRVAISNRRLIACNEKGVTFKWKDYRLEGRERYQVMTLATDEFIRRFLMHVLPAGFHRIRYYGLLASGKRADNIARARELLRCRYLPVDAIKAANTKHRSAANARASLSLLRRPHDHHRAVRARLNSALSAKPADASDQDRHLMIMSIRSPSFNAGHLCRRRSDEHASARTNSLLIRQPVARSSLFWPRADQRKPAGMLRPAQSLHLSPRARTHAARSPLKSP